MSSSARPSTYPVAARDESGAVVDIAIAGEHPLTVYVDRREILTLMTLGAAPEALVLGYLRNQRLVERLEDVLAIHVDWEVNAASVTTRDGLVDLDARLERRTKTTGCGSGTVFGDLMADIEAIRLLPRGQLRQSTLYRLADLVRRHETIYKQAGAVHGCALFSAAAELRYFVEDVGRHNAVDAIAGMMWLDDIEGADHIFYTTGRLTSEMVIKAAQMGIPCLVSRSGVTEMGFRLAREVGMTLIGRAVNRRFLILHDPGRFVYDVEASTPAPATDQGV